MSRQYPIWNEVENCLYSSSKSYGNRDNGKVRIHIGSSSSNSHFFLEHQVTRYYDDEEDVWLGWHIYL